MLKAVWDLHAICVVCVTEKEQELETESVHGFCTLWKHFFYYLAVYELQYSLA